MSTYRLKLSSPALKLLIGVRIPAQLVEGPGISITKANGVYLFKSDFTNMAPGPISDAATSYVAIFDQASGLYRYVSLESLLESGLDADTQAIAALTGTGILARTADGSWALRSLSAPAAGLTISNPAGIAGNPTFALANDLAALEALSGTNTIYYRSAADTWTAVTIGSLLSFSGGTLNVGNAELAAIAANASNGLWARTGAGTGAARSVAPGSGITVSNGDGVSGNPTVGLDINGLTEDTTPDGANDFVATYDASASAPKKVKLSNLPGGSGGSGITVNSTSITSGTNGRLLYDNSGTVGEITTGTSGYALMSTGAAAPAYTGFLQSGTGAVARTWNSKAADVLHIEDFGNVSGGVVDAAPAINAAVARAQALGGATIMLGAASYRIATPIIVTGTGIRIKGAGVDATRVIVDAAAIRAFYFGYTSLDAIYCGISDLTITRTGDTVPSGSYGIFWASFNYGIDSNVRVDRFDIGRNIDGVNGTSIGLELYTPYSTNIQNTDYIINAAADITVHGGESGKNGGELFDRVSIVKITGGANACRFIGTTFVPRGPGVSKPSLFLFASYTNTTGVIGCFACNGELLSSIVASDSGTSAINEMTIVGGRFTYDGSFWDLNAATRLGYSKIIGNNMSSLVSFANYLGNPLAVVFADNIVGGHTEFAGGTGAVAALRGNIFTGGANFTMSGAWTKLNSSGNISVSGTVFDTATGTKYTTGNN